jgi:hypothetical protein
VREDNGKSNSSHYKTSRERAEKELSVGEEFLPGGPSKQKFHNSTKALLAVMKTTTSPCSEQSLLYR